MKRKTPWSQLDAFTSAYITAFFFTETPEGRLPRGEYAEWHARPEWDLFPVADQQRIIQECIDFQGAQAAALQDYPTDRAGHDFLYSRNGHGRGFWENDFGTEEQCEILQAAAKAAGPRYLERYKGKELLPMKTPYTITVQFLSLERAPLWMTERRAPYTSTHPSAPAAFAELDRLIETNELQQQGDHLRYNVHDQDGKKLPALVPWYSAHFGEPPRTLQSGEIRFPRLTPYRRARA